MVIDALTNCGSLMVALLDETAIKTAQFPVI